MSAELLGQFSTRDMRKMPSFLRQGVTEYEEPYVVSVAIIGVMKYYDDFTVGVFVFFEEGFNLYFFFCASRI